jgi:transposase-like protein
VKVAAQPGRSVSAVARELGVERSVLKHWIDNFAAGNREGRLFVAVVIDLFSRRVVG